MTGRTRALAVCATMSLVLALGALAAADVLVPGSRSAPWLQDAGLVGGSDGAPARTVSARSVPAVLSCPAAPTTVPVEGTDQQFSAQPVPTTATVRVVADAATTAGLRVLPLGTADASAGPAAPVPAPVVGDVLTQVVEGAAPVHVLAAPALLDVTPDPAALQSALTTAGDLRGLSAGVCAPPAARSWLVGGGVQVGRSSRLVLSNPGATPAVVDVSLLSGTGRQVPRAGQGLLVPPGQLLELLVEGLTALDPLLAVGVSSSGGSVTASLVDTAVLGLTPAGVDVVTPSAPRRRHVVTGIPADPAGTDRTVLRIAVPDDAPAVVGWRVEGPAGPVAGDDPAATTVPGGSVVDVPLDAVGTGPASVVVESDVPVLASVQVTRPAPADPLVVERAWVASAEPVTGTALLALPGGGVAAGLVLSAGADPGETAVPPAEAPPADMVPAEVVPADVQVVPVLPDGSRGDAVQVAVVPGRTSAVAPEVLAGAVAVRLEVRSGSVHAAAVLTASSDAAVEGADLISVVSVPARALPPGMVVVRSAPEGSWP